MWTPRSRRGWGVGGARLLSARPPGDGVYTCLGQWSQAPEVLCLHPLSEDTDQGNIVQGGWGVVRVVQMGGPGEPHVVTVWWKVQDDCKRHGGGRHRTFSLTNAEDKAKADPGTKARSPNWMTL